MTPTGAVVWARAPGMLRWQLERVGPQGRSVAEGPVNPAFGGSIQVRLTRLSPGASYQVRVRFFGQELGTEPAVASFRTPGGPSSSFRLGWSGDLVGQGYGIDPSRGGLFIFQTLAAESLDAFLFCGDTVYADHPLPSSFLLQDGARSDPAGRNVGTDAPQSVWRNRVTEAKSKVAQDLDGFRGQYAYPWLDPAYRRFWQHTPVIAQWDDHELFNNWAPPALSEGSDSDDTKPDPRAAFAAQAFRENFPLGGQPVGDPNPFWAAPDPASPLLPIRGAVWATPIARYLSLGPWVDLFALDGRSFRGPNRVDARGDLLGAAQLDAWTRLFRSTPGRFKVVASNTPFGLVVPDGPGRVDGFADGRSGRPKFRERELARLYRAARRAKVRDLVVLTADVHYAAAHLHRPHPRLRVHEFVAGPLHAGQFGPAELDDSFRGEVCFANRSRGDPMNLAPTPTTTSYGVVEVDPGGLTVTLKDGAGRQLHRTRIPA